MLCRKCNNPLICGCCGETEYSDYVKDGHKFRPDDCQYCKENPTYINKDFMWYAKSALEAVLILIASVCLIGFVISLFMMLFDSKTAAGVMGVSFSVGAINMLFMVSCDKDWRVWYEDHSCSC